MNRRDFIATSAALAATAGWQAPPAKKATVVLFQGDSITDGNRGRSADPNHILGPGDQTWPEIGFYRENRPIFGPFLSYAVDTAKAQ